MFLIFALAGIYGKPSDEFRLKYKYIDDNTFNRITILVRLGVFLSSFIFLATAASLCNF
jgi:hypothetical protein